MNRRLRLTIIAILAVMVFHQLNKTPLDEVKFSDDLREVAVPNEIVLNQPLSFDFETCTLDTKIGQTGSLGNSTLSVLEKTGAYCVVKTRFESPTGFYSNECNVPLSLGSVNFLGNNFEEINQYCSINVEGTGLLELN